MSQISFKFHVCLYWHELSKKCHGWPRLEDTVPEIIEVKVHMTNEYDVSEFDEIWREGS